MNDLSEFPNVKEDAKRAISYLKQALEYKNDGAFIGQMIEAITHLSLNDWKVEFDEQTSLDEYIISISKNQFSVDIMYSSGDTTFGLVDISNWARNFIKLNSDLIHFVPYVPNEYYAGLDDLKKVFIELIAFEKNPKQGIEERPLAFEASPSYRPHKSKFDGFVWNYKPPMQYYYVMDCFELEELIERICLLRVQEEYNIKNYEVHIDMGWNNDESHAFSIDMPEGEELEDILKRFQEWRENIDYQDRPENQMSCTEFIMPLLVYLGVLPQGRYLIQVSW